MSAHCDDTNDNDRAPHETWQLQAEEVIRTAAEAGENVGRLSWAFLRINIDGYNGVLKSGRISYFLPRGEPYGWPQKTSLKLQHMPYYIQITTRAKYTASPLSRSAWTTWPQ